MPTVNPNLQMATVAPAQVGQQVQPVPQNTMMPNMQMSWPGMMPNMQARPLPMMMTSYQPVGPSYQPMGAMMMMQMFQQQQYGFLQNPQKQVAAAPEPAKPKVAAPICGREVDKPTA